MKIAYLILAHGRPDHAARLVRRLDDGGATFFFHVDAKADEGPFRRSVGNARFVADRVDVRWCAFSMVEATLRLLRDSYEAGADRFVLLSGVDYPLRSNAVIRAEMERDVEYIQVDRRLDPNGNGEFDIRANRYFFGDIKLLNPRTCLPHTQRLILKGRKFLPRRHFPRPVFYGSQWWALTRAAIEEVRRVQRDEAGLIQAFRYAQASDEMLFQTILKASTRSDRIAFDVVDGGYVPHRHQACLHHVDWDHPNPDLPRVLDLSDEARLRGSKALFARKTDDRSRELLEAIDAAT